jgi:hypothetical protein
MKKIIPLLVFIFLSAIAYSQSFIDTTKVWNVAKCSGGGIGWFCENFSYKFIGDTVINNQVYKKLMTKLDSSNYTWGFSIAMREAGDKIYSYTNSGEELSYDFGAYAGDTLKQLGPSFNHPMIVTSVDTVFISGLQRKRLMFYHSSNIWPYEIWIEGIGSLKGIANTIVTYNDLWADYDQVTLCYWENSNLIYIDSTFNSCFIVNDITEIERSNSLQIYPNPTPDILILKFNRQISFIAYIDFFNSRGQLVKKISEEKFNQGKNQITIPVSDIPPGIYFLKLYVDERLITKKFIKN